MVDWPAFWRLRKAYTKLSESKEQRPTYLALDATGSMGFGDPSRWDYGRRVAAALAFVALDNGDLIRAVQFAERPEQVLREMRGLGRFRELCERLDGLELIRRGSVSQSLRGVPALCPGRGILIVLSDFLDPQISPKAFSTLASSRHEVVLVHLVSPWEAAPSLTSDVELEDLETGEILKVGPDSEVLQEYRRAFREHAEQLRSSALRRGMHYLFARTDQSEISLVRRILNVLNS